MKFEPRKMKFYGIRDVEKLPQLQNLPAERRFEMKVVASVLPMRSNNYVVEDLINWDNIPHDPMYQLTFMQKGMLTEKHFEQMADVHRSGGDAAVIRATAERIRRELNPHPSGQMTANVPMMDEEPVMGVQHKYRETCLVFPSSGQTCHAYCTFCFRWPQFVGMDDLKFATDESLRFQDYLETHKEITDVLFTGGDPMVMSIKNLKAYIEPLLAPEFDHIQTVRIGTKSVAYWPYRFVTDKDSDDIIRLFEKVVASGKHLALMGHYNHHVELSTPIAQEAVRRIRSSGAEIRAQSPIIKHVNDDAEVWAKMWTDQVRLGVIPYYMFVERNTGAKSHFALPLVRAFEIFRDAIQQVSGLGRTVRGPSMSALPGKVTIEGIANIKGEKVFVLSLIQARNPDWVRRPFFAKYDENATWIHELKPAFGQTEFFYERELHEMLEAKKQKVESFNAAQSA